MNKQEENMVNTICEKHENSLWSYAEEKEFHKNAGPVFSSAINSFCVDFKGIVSGILSSPQGIKNMDQIAGCWIKALDMQYKETRYDDRNEYSALIGSKLIQRNYLHDFVQEQSSGYAPLNARLHRTYTFGMYLSDYMCREHRTLQQTFSRLVFQYLKERFPQLSCVNDSETWERCPLI